MREISKAELFSLRFDSGTFLDSAGWENLLPPDAPTLAALKRVVPQRMAAARQFVFEPELTSGFNSVCKDQPLESPLDLPFPAVWLEIKGARGMLQMQYPAGEIMVFGILAWQVGVSTQWLAMALVLADKRPVFLSGGHALTGSPLSELNANVATYMHHLFVRFRSSGASFLERSTARYKIGSGASRLLVQPKKIVRIVLKSERKKYEKSFGQPIDWSHQWEVMGHWRQTSGTGKDREGHYCVPGFTWVAPHRKGPEDKVFVKKTREVLQAGSYAAHR